MSLAFGWQQTTVLMMDKPWYRKVFGHAPAPDLETTQTKADRGDADAQFSLGLECASRGGEIQNCAQAAQWYLRAADQNHPLAQFNLGVMYATGQGVPQDDAKSLMWFQKAARQGDAGAQFNLGMRHHHASIRGQPQDAIESKLEAYKWLHLAAAQGYKGSETACDSVTLSMTGEEVVEGNQRVADFLATQPPEPKEQGASGT
jgi:TPR repeat protein